MRLIDADEAIKNFENMCKAQLVGNKNTTLISYADVIDAIEEQATAYDIEKVVAELEKRSNEVISNIFAYEEDDHIGIYNNGLADGYENAIDIVRKGGVKNE